MDNCEHELKHNKKLNWVYCTKCKQIWIPKLKNDKEKLTEEEYNRIFFLLNEPPLG